jgi:hypothetical protein
MNEPRELLQAQRPQTVDARVTALKSGSLKLVCGNRPCTGHLGFARWTPSQGPTVRNLMARHAERLAGRGRLSKWKVSPPMGYTGYRSEPGDAPDTYRPWRRKRTETPPRGQRDAGRYGRTAMPRSMQSARDKRRGGRGLVGRFPCLPATIVCPQCGAKNAVPLPQREGDAV